MRSYRTISPDDLVSGLASRSPSPLLLPVVGTQWGDEGKGAAIALLAPHFGLDVRLAGGPNAGHTVNIGDRFYAVHMLPSGVFFSSMKSALSGGMVIDLHQLVNKEISMVEGLGIGLEGRLFIDGGAHVILPHAKIVEIVNEERQHIGSTFQGIGPSYEAKAARLGVRINTVLNRELLHESLEARSDALHDFIKGASRGTQRSLVSRIKANIGSRQMGDDYRDFLLLALGGASERKELERRLFILGQEVADYVTSVPLLIRDEMRAGSPILFECAQGTLLDIDHGLYPMVTSSNASALGAPAQSGIPAHLFSRPVGIAKWYTTKVGGGGFPGAYVGNDELKGKGYTRATKLSGSEAKALLANIAPADVQARAEAIDRGLRDLTDNYGTTSGRPRMGSRFDAVATGYGARLNDAQVFLSMLDTVPLNPDTRFVMAYTFTGKPMAFNGVTYTEGDIVTADNFVADDRFIRQCRPAYGDLRDHGADLQQSDLLSIRKGHVSARMARFVGLVEGLLGQPVVGLRYGPKQEHSCFIERA